MRSLSPRQCMATNGTRASATSVGHGGVGEAAADVVDEHGAGGEGGVRDLGAGGVDADGEPGVGERLDDGQDAAQLLLQRRPAGAGAGRLAADVEDVGTVRGEREPAGDRVAGLEPPPAVAERVGGDVDDAHDEAAVQGRELGGQAAGCRTRRSGDTAVIARRSGPG